MSTNRSPLVSPPGATCPKDVKAGVSKSEAEEIKKKLEAAGAKVQLK